MFTTKKMCDDQLAQIRSVDWPLIVPLRDIVADYAIDPRLEAFFMTPSDLCLTAEWTSASGYGWARAIGPSHNRYGDAPYALYIDYAPPNLNQWTTVTNAGIHLETIWNFMCGAEMPSVYHDIEQAAAQTGDDPRRVYENLRTGFRFGCARRASMREAADVAADRLRQT